MNFAQKKSRSSLLGLALLVVFPTNLTAQSQKDETQTAPTTGTINGLVVTETGQPLPNATVALRGSTPFFQPRMTVTDNEGRFQVSGLDAALYGVSAFAPGYISLPRDPDSPPVDYRIGDSVEVSMVKGGVITGSVMSLAGEPVVQSPVRAVLIRDENGQQPRYQPNHMPRATDDRGFYRIYGLVPGTYLVSAGGRGSFGFSSGAYDRDAPTYAPSSTRDTAAEVTVRAGEEMSGVDIRYRGEPGRTVSGLVIGLPEPTGSSQPNVNLTQISHGAPLVNAFAFQAPNSKGFAFYGVSDGYYDLAAQLSLGPGEILGSEQRRITVKGADITGIELTVKPLGAIGGRVALETSDAPECSNKRRPLFSEALIVARQSEKNVPKDQPRLRAFFIAQGSPNQSGDFLLHNLAPGQYNLNTRFFAKYWYLRSIARDAPATRPSVAKAGAVSPPTDAARNGLVLKIGERISGLTVTLAEGAASLRGTIKPAPGESVLPKLYVHLVPSEKENADDVLRVFAAAVNSDGTFALNNLPPGRYWALARVAADNELQLDSKVRLPEESELRAQIRRAAEAGKASVEFKPCQNIADYELPFTLVPRKN